MTSIFKSLWLLLFTIVICCLIYTLAVWAIGQTFFSFSANGSIVNGPDGKPAGSLLIAQPFTKTEYFWPPSFCRILRRLGGHLIGPRRL